MAGAAQLAVVPMGWVVKRGTDGEQRVPMLWNKRTSGWQVLGMIGLFSNHDR